MSALDSVDLRAAGDEVYSQIGSNSCYAHAPVHALEILLRRAGQPQKLSRAWLYWQGRLHQGPGREYLDVGLNADDMKWALEHKGVVLESDYPWERKDFAPVDRPSRIGQIAFAPMRATIEAIERKLCLGIPVVFGFWMNESYHSIGSSPWRTHDWWRPSPILGGHGVCIVGYDRTAQRLLVKNNFGPLWGDNGCFGIPYKHFSDVQSGAWTIDRIAGSPLKPVDGYMTVPYLLDSNDNGYFTSKNKPRLMQEASDALAAGGTQGLIDWCKRSHVTDKHLENIFSADRGTVRAFQDANPALDWAGFPWAQM